MRNNDPNLFARYMDYAIFSIAFGLNFILARPAFMPFDTPKAIIGAIFLLFGIQGLALLLLKANGRAALRASMGLTVFIYSFWAGALTFEFFRLSQTSMQLPIAFIGLAWLGYRVLREPFANPATTVTGTNEPN